MSLWLVALMRGMCRNRLKAVQAPRLRPTRYALATDISRPAPERYSLIGKKWVRAARGERYQELGTRPASRNRNWEAHGKQRAKKKPAEAGRVHHAMLARSSPARPRSCTIMAKLRRRSRRVPARSWDPVVENIAGTHNPQSSVVALLDQILNAFVSKPTQTPIQTSARPRPPLIAKSGQRGCSSSTGASGWTTVGGTSLCGRNLGRPAGRKSFGRSLLRGALTLDGLKTDHVGSRYTFRHEHDPDHNSALTDCAGVGDRAS